MRECLADGLWDSTAPTCQIIGKTLKLYLKSSCKHLSVDDKYIYYNLIEGMLSVFTYIFSSTIHKD